MIKAAGAKKERETRAIVVKQEGRSHTKGVMKEPTCSLAVRHKGVQSRLLREQRKQTEFLGRMMIRVLV